MIFRIIKTLQLLCELINAANARVGIGTTSPTEKLAVDGNIETAQSSGKIGFNVGEAYGDFPHYTV